MTRNGKLNRKALPSHLTKTLKNYVPPGNELEVRLADIWAELLGMESDQVGIHDNFFELGGHSLNATLLVSRVHQQLQVKLPLSEIFKTPNIKGLAQYILQAEADRFVSIEPSERKEYYILSPAQQRLFVLQQMELTGTVYNMSDIYPLESEPDPNRIEETFRELIRRHESFRTSFRMIDGRPVQQIHAEAPFAIDSYQYEEGVNDGVEAILDRFVRFFDLSRPPLLRAGLLNIPGNKHFLIIDMHHIISDAVSHDVLSREFMDIYEGRPLTELRIQYKDYAQWYDRQKEQGVIKKQQDHWLKLFEDDPPVLEMITDYRRPAVQSFHGDTVRVRLDSREARSLNDFALNRGVTLYMVLLAAYNVLLSALSSQEDIVVGTPVAGRRHADLRHIIGVFINTLALRNFPQGGKTFDQFLEDVKTSTLQAFETRITPLKSWWTMYGGIGTPPVILFSISCLYFTMSPPQLRVKQPTPHRRIMKVKPGKRQPPFILKTESLNLILH